jgi:hypothetical protein
VKDRTGQKLGYFYYEEEPDPAVIGQAAHEGRGPADRGQYRQVAGTAGPQLKPLHGDRRSQSYALSLLAGRGAIW